MEGCGGVLEGSLDSGGIGDAALGHVFAAAASATEFCKRLFHKGAHVVGLSG